MNAGSNRIVETDRGNFRVGRDGRITGPFPGRPLYFEKALIFFVRVDGRWTARMKNKRERYIRFKPLDDVSNNLLERILRATPYRVPQTLTAERRAKISAALKGRPGQKLTRETRAKISAGMMGKNTGKYIGRKMSPEWIAKVIASRKRTLDRKRLSQVQEPNDEDQYTDQCSDVACMVAVA